MGMFGNKDVKALERELLGLRMALTMGSGASRSADQFRAGVASAQEDSVAIAARIKNAGKAAEGMAVVAKMRGSNKLSGDSRGLYDALLFRVESTLT